MKLFNKKTQEKKVANVTKLEKSQLEKVIGGAETTLTTSTETVDGNPIGGVIVKGGKNPGGQL